MPDLSPASVTQALHSLREVLEREKSAGHSHVAISRDSLQRLRDLPARMRTPKSAAPAATPSPRPHQATTPRPSPAPSTLRINPSASILTPPGASKAEKIAWLAREAEQCQACRSLGTLRDTMVFSTGNPDAALMFVGEAPGFEEERQREPFVGPAGQLLTKIIVAMGLRRPDDVYISNIVKFRPLEGDARFQGQRNRKPTPVEMSAAVKYVLAEIAVVQPRAIVALGGTAAEGLLEMTGSVSSLRGRFFDLRGTPVMVTYHPSYLLREESKSPDQGKAEKRKVWEDMLLVMERLGLPITDRQRRFFA